MLVLKGAWLDDDRTMVKLRRPVEVPAELETDTPAGAGAEVKLNHNGFDLYGSGFSDSVAVICESIESCVAAPPREV